LGRPDIAVIGAGHNGLACAAYLAKAGQDVVVVERRTDVGGCTRTIDFPSLPDWRVNTCADVDIFFHNGPVPSELELSKFGLRMLEREAVYFAPFLDGSSLFFWPDIDRTMREIAKFSKNDADAYRDYIAYWKEAFDRIGPLALGAPPRNADLMDALGGDTWADEFLQLLVTPGDSIAKGWFESPQMQGIMAWQMSLYSVPPEQAGVGMGFGHLAGSVLNGIQRPVGGTGALSAALRACVEAHQGRIITGNGVKRISIDDSRATGVELDDGSTLNPRNGIVSSIDAKRVFLDLVEEGVLPKDEQRAVEAVSVNNISFLRVSLALSDLPRFDSRYGDGEDFVRNSTQASPMLCADSWETVQMGWNQVWAGELPERANTMWIGVPTAMDNTIAPPDCHVISFAEYVPFTLKEGSWSERKAEAAERVIATWCEVAGDTQKHIRGVWVQSPEDIAGETGNIHGNPFHVDELFHQMFGMRPTSRMSQYRTPIGGLYLSGAGVHPGGGVTGLPGRNSALAVLADITSNAAASEQTNAPIQTTPTERAAGGEGD
jgi:beta-carotene ketolase (CrtO type)